MLINLPTKLLIHFLQNVLIVVSVCEDSVGHRSLRQRKDISAKISVDLLDTFDKAEVIRQILFTHAKKLDESLFNNQVGFNRSSSLGLRRLTNN